MALYPDDGLFPDVGLFPDGAATDWATWVGVPGVTYAPSDATKGPLLVPGITELQLTDLPDVDWIGPSPATPTAQEVLDREGVSPWGITAAGVPYYDTAGATVGERGRLEYFGGNLYIEVP